MKYITQLEEYNNLAFDSNSAKEYTYDPETYAYFLDLDESNYKQFLAYNYSTILKSINNVPNWDIYRKRSVLNKKRNEFNMARDKFYIYNEKIYSYQYLGEFNVGHVIEIVEYETSEVIKIMNLFLKKEKKQGIISLIRKIISYS